MDAWCLTVDCTSPQMSYHAAVIKSATTREERGTEGTGREGGEEGRRMGVSSGEER